MVDIYDLIMIIICIDWPSIGIIVKKALTLNRQIMNVQKCSHECDATFLTV